MHADHVKDILPDVLYPRELDALIRPYIHADAPGAPRNMREALQFVQQHMRNYGFSDSLVLRMDLAQALVEGFTPREKETFRAIINDVESFTRRNNIDRFSGGLQKSMAFETTALAHLYVRQQKKPFALVEADFSGMGGTNIFFRQLLAAERGVSAAEVPEDDAKRYTDRCARALVKTILQKLQEKIGEDEDITFIRAGGDELRFIVPSLKPEDHQAVKDSIHEAVEEVTAKLGLHTHPNQKALLNMLRSGFGVAVEISDMSKIKSIDDLNNMYAKISETKPILGIMRHPELLSPSDLTPEILKRSQQLRGITAAAKTGINTLPAERMVNIRGHLRGMAKGIRAIFANAMGHATKSEHGELYDRLIEADAYHPGKYFVSPMEKYKAVINKYIEEIGIELTPYHRRIIAHATDSLMSVDPVTNTWLERDMPQCAAIYIRDTEKLAREQGKPDWRAHLIGFSFLNLGGLNSKLGQQGADEVLRMYADIMKEEMKKVGLNVHEHYEIAHYGGAEFHLLVQPAIEVNGQWKEIDKKMLDDVTDKVIERMDFFKKQTVKKFMKQRGIDCHLSEHMTFDDIPVVKEEHLLQDGVPLMASVTTLDRATEKSRNIGGLAIEASRKRIRENVDLFREYCIAVWKDRRKGLWDSALHDFDKGAASTNEPG